VGGFAQLLNLRKNDEVLCGEIAKDKFVDLVGPERC
jgi:hypothetical protein